MYFFLLFIWCHNNLQLLAMNPPCWFHLLTQIWHGLICGHCSVKSVDAFPWKRRSVWCSSFVSDPYTISKRLQALSMHNKDWKITHNHTMCKLAALYTCVLIALNPTFSASIGAGCDIIATSTSSKTPSSNKIILPPPPSSPGVPITDNCKDHD